MELEALFDLGKFFQKSHDCGDIEDAYERLKCEILELGEKALNSRSKQKFNGRFSEYCDKLNSSGFLKTHLFKGKPQKTPHYQNDVKIIDDREVADQLRLLIERSAHRNKGIKLNTAICQLENMGLIPVHVGRFGTATSIFVTARTALKVGRPDVRPIVDNGPIDRAPEA